MIKFRNSSLLRSLCTNPYAKKSDSNSKKTDTKTNKPDSNTNKTDSTSTKTKSNPSAFTTQDYNKLFTQNFNESLNQDFEDQLNALEGKLDDELLEDVAYGLLELELDKEGKEGTESCIQFGIMSVLYHLLRYEKKDIFVEQKKLRIDYKGLGLRSYGTPDINIGLRQDSTYQVLIQGALHNHDCITKSLLLSAFNLAGHGLTLEKDNFELYGVTTSLHCWTFLKYMKQNDLKTIHISKPVFIGNVFNGEDIQKESLERVIQRLSGIIELQKATQIGEKKVFINEEC